MISEYGLHILLESKSVLSVWHINYQYSYM